MQYYRPIIHYGGARPVDALSIGGGSAWFSSVEILSRETDSKMISASHLPDKIRDALCAPRADFAGLPMDRPHVMGVLNTTPDSFSDGGLHHGSDDAITRAYEMHKQGASIIDVGGESTRPGADFVDRIEEFARVMPVISEISNKMIVSVDTRKADVARQALNAGAVIFNDVSALSFDPRSLAVASEMQSYVCLMHASGDPKTMQDNLNYDNIILDVYDYLSSRVQTCIDAGIPKSHISIDPGIGFGKTTEHNLLLIKHLSLFHGIGCPILLGVSRKRFIGEIGNAQDPAKRIGGSIAVGLEAVRQGVQLLRVHDVLETVQAFQLFGVVR